MSIFKGKSAKLPITPVNSSNEPLARKVSLTVNPPDAKCTLTLRGIGSLNGKVFTAEGLSHQTFNISEGTPVWGGDLVISAPGYNVYHDFIIVPATDTELPTVTLELSISPLAIDGHSFMRDGFMWRYKGFTGFKLCDLFSRGIDITPMLLKDFNVVRTFLYTPVKDWGAQFWPLPSIDVINNYVSFLATLGYYVELVLLTDDDPASIDPAIAVVQGLKGHDNLFLQIGNEPLTHKNINCAALKAVCDSSGYIYSSGIFEDNTKAFGRVWSDHSGGDSEWPRKPKGMIEAYTGGGPNSPNEPALKIPCYEDESPRPDITIGYQNGNQDLTALDYYTFAAVASICGNGATFHFEPGKFGQPPNDFERKCADSFLQGLNVFPITDNRDYRRIDEGSVTLRTYIIGNCMVRVRPTIKSAPETGWNSLDSYGICWSR